MQVVEVHGSYRYFSRKTDLTQAQRQKLDPPFPNIGRPLGTSPLQRPAKFEKDDGWNGQFTGGESRVAALACRLSEVWRLLGQPQERVSIEQEGHRIVQ